MIPTEETLNTLDRLAQLVENHGALVLFAIISGLINTYFIVQLIKGRLVPVKYYDIMRAEYEKANKEADRLQRVMEKERVSSMAKLLEFMSGLKKETKEERQDAAKSKI